MHTLILSARFPQLLLQVMYVGPHDLLTILKDMDAIFGGTRRCCVARELTKVHEEFWRGSIGEAVKEFSLRKPRGEVRLLFFDLNWPGRQSGLKLQLYAYRVAANRFSHTKRLCQ